MVDKVEKRLVAGGGGARSAAIVTGSMMYSMSTLARGLKAGLGLALVFALAESISMSVAQAQLYKEASPELNKRAEQKLRSLFNARSETGTRQLFGGKILICGPFLWRALQNAKELEGANSMESIFVSPNPTSNGDLGFADHGKGRTFNTPKGVDAFRRAFLGRYPADGKTTIRKLKMAEIRLFLTMIPFAAEEPLFAVESKNHRFIVNMDKDLHILWIDDYLHLR